MRAVALAFALVAAASPAAAKKIKNIKLPPIIVTPSPNAFAAVPCKDLLNKLPLGCTPRESPVDAAKNSIVQSFLGAVQNLVDPEDAITLSMQIDGLQDPVGNVCWKSFRGIKAVVKAHPQLLTGNVPGDYEALRLIHIGLNQICANPNCAAMWTDLQNVAGAINPLIATISLGSVCAKVPVATTNSATYVLPLVDAGPQKPTTPTPEPTPVPAPNEPTSTPVAPQ